MRTRFGKSINHFVALALLCLILVTFSGCASNDSENRIYCNDYEWAAYSELATEMLPSYSVEKTNYFPFVSLEHGVAAEAFDAQAQPALENGVAEYWYPQYLATVIIAVDRDQTDADIGGWRDLSTTDENVGLPHRRIGFELFFAAIAYGLEGDNFTLDSAVALCSDLRAKNHLVTDSCEQPIVICYDYQAAAMIRGGRNMEIIIPSEGTITFEMGLLSHSELTFPGDAGAGLLATGYRLPDGRCDETLYPDAAAYQNAYRIADYEHFNTVCQDTTRVFRRSVLHIRLYSSADAREHQFLVLLYMIVVVVWLASVINRAMQKGVRRAALFTGIILLGWIIVRLVKYQTGEASTLNRYLWYGYYPFQLALPLVVLWLAWMLDKPEDHSMMPSWLRFLAVIDALLVALVFTNDLHGLVFRLDISNPNWSREYSYGFSYYIVLSACVLPLLASIFMLLYKSGRNPRKRGFIYPLAFILLLCAYSYGYIARVPLAWESDFTMVVGLFTLLLFEAAMRTGLIPVNSKYAILFTHSSLGMQIINGSGQAVLSSAPLAPRDNEIIARALAVQPLPAQEDENTLLYAARIAGGHALWQEDLSGLNRLHAEVEESVRRLAAANAVLSEEEKLKRAIGEENAKTQLMIGLEGEIAGHVARLAAMIEQLEYASDSPKEVARIALLLCYVKRRCNLFFREQEMEALPANELAVYMDELAEITPYAGVKIIVTCEPTAPLPVRQATLFYDFFYQVIDWAASRNCPTMLAHLGTEDGSVTLRLLPSADARSFALSTESSRAIAFAGGTYLQKDLDDAVGISLTFPEGGEGIG